MALPPDYSEAAFDAMMEHHIPARAEWWAEAAIDYPDTLVGRLYVEKIRAWASPCSYGERAYMMWDHDPEHPIKIGVSTDPVRRLRNVRATVAATMPNLRLVMVFPPDPAMEYVLHSLFHKDALDGPLCPEGGGYEWFVPSTRLVDFIERVGWGIKDADIKAFMKTLDVP